VYRGFHYAVTVVRLLFVHVHVDLSIARRAAFFLTYVLYDKSNPVSTTQFKELGALGAILETVKSEDSDLREKVSSKNEDVFALDRYLST